MIKMSKLDKLNHAIRIAEIAEVPLVLSRHEGRYIMDIIEIQKDALIDIHDYCMHCIEDGEEPARAIFYIMNKIMKTSRKIEELDSGE